MTYVKDFSKRNFEKEVVYEDIFRDYFTVPESKEVMEKAHKIYLMSNPSTRKRILSKSSRTLKQNPGTFAMNKHRQVDYKY